MRHIEAKNDKEKKYGKEHLLSSIKTIFSKLTSTVKFKKIMVFNAAFLLCFASLSTPVLANPQGGQVTAGVATIQQVPNNTTINQSSQKAIINWQSFNIGQQEATHFQQPAGGVALNRINPAQGPSQIYGHLSATGQIILINGAGIFFGPSAYVNVGGIIASTADITDQNFLNGNYRFSQVLPYSGSVINEGQIIAANHGLVALIGASVSNKGLIQANLGQIVLASGSAFTMTFAGNEMIGFSVDAPSMGGVDQNGKPLRNGVNNSGKLVANGGRILVTAQMAQGVLDNAINMQGIAEAKSVGVKNGEIILMGSEGGVKVSGKIIASGKKQGQTGGKVKILGSDVALVDNANIDVSGDLGGGLVLIGGNAHGAGPELNAKHTYVGPNVIINANALTKGNGGNVVVWSDIGTQVYGNILVRGGEKGGNGGWVETSGKNFLGVNGAKVDARAPLGLTGTWLLDPTNIYIATNQANATAAGMTGTDTSANTGTGGNPNTFAGSGAVQDSLLTTGNLTTALATANVVVTTTNPSGTGVGNITVVDGFSWASGNTLTMTAANNIAINGTITTGAAGSALILNAGGTVTQTAIIAGAGGLTLQGPGTTILNQLNTYTGATNINAGTVVVNTLANAGTSSSLGTGTASPAINLGAATLQYTGAGSSSSRVINLTGAGTLDASGIGALTLSGGITGNTQNLILKGSGVGTESGAITTTTGGVTKTGSGTWTLSSAASSYSGGTAVNGGTLSVGKMALAGNNSGIGTGALAIDTGGIFSYTGANVTTDRAITVGSGGGTIQAINAVARTLTLMGGINNAGALTFDTTGAGPANITVSTNAISGAGSLTKTGTGTLTLAGANSFTGATAINAGTLTLTNANGLGSGATQSSDVTVASGAALNMNFATATLGNTNVITLNGTGVGGTGALTGNRNTDTLSNAITLGSNTTIGGARSLILSGIISDGGNGFSLTKVGTNTLTLSGVNTYSGGTTVDTGTLSVTNRNGLGTTGLIAVNNAAILSLNLGGNTLQNSSGLTISGTGSLTGVVAAGNTDTLNNAITLTGGSATITSSTANGTLALTGGITNGTTNLLFTGAGITTESGVIGGGGGTLTKAGTGRLTLSGTNTYTGATAINAGTLSVTNTDGLGGATGGAIAVATGSTLNFNLGGGTLANTNSLSLAGTAALTDTTAAGTTDTLNNAITLAAAATPTITSTTATAGFNLGGGIANNGTSLTVTGSGNTTESGAISGSGALTKTGTGTFTLSGLNNYTGATAINAGTLSVTNANGLGGATGGTIGVATGATLNLNLGGAALANANTLTLTGTAALTDTTAAGTTDTLNNPIVIAAAGTPTITSTNATANLALTGGITNNGTRFTMTGSGDSSESGLISGPGALTKAGTGTFTLPTSNSYVGVTTINGGVLNVTDAGGLGSPGGTTIINTGGTLQINNVAIGNELINLNNGGILNGVGNASLAGNITLAGTLGTSRTISTSSGSDVFTLSGTINGGAPLILAGSGTIVLANAIGNTTALSSLTSNAGTTVLSGGSVITSGVQTYNNAVTLGANTTLATTNNAVTFASTLDRDITAARDLTINARSGAIALMGNVGAGANGALGAISLNSTGTTTISGTLAAANLTTNAGGSTILNTSNITTSGSQIYNDAVTLATIAKNLTSTAGSITFGSTLSGAFGLTLSGNTGVIFNGIVGAVALANLDVTGATTINTTNITTSGAQTYHSGITLGANTTLATANNAVILLGTLDRDATAARNLTINAGSGAITLAGNAGAGVNGALGVINLNSTATTTIGGTLAATSLTTNAGGTTALNGGSITTTGAQVYNDAVTLGTDTTLDASSGPITFASTVNSFDATARSLTLNTSGTTTFGGAVGGIFALQALTTDAGGTTVINGGTIITSTGAQTYGDAVRLGANTILNSGGGITLDSTVNGAAAGAQSLTLSVSAGTLALNGVIGGVKRLSSFSATNTGVANDITINNNINTTGNISLTAGRNVLLNNGNLNSTAGNIFLTGTNGLIQEMGSSTIRGVLLTASAVGGILLNNANTVSSFNATNTVSGDVQLTNTGALNITGISQAVGDLVIANTGTIIQSGQIIANGIGKIASFSAGATNNITLANTSNDFTTVAIGSGRNVILNDVNALDLGASTIRGSFTVDAGGSITQSGVLNVSGTPTFTVHAANSDILLGNAANSFAQTAIFTNNGNVRDIALWNIAATAGVSVLPSNLRNLSLIFDNAGMALPGTTLSGNLIASAGGNITQSGALNVSGTSTFTVTAPSSNILLDTAANNFSNTPVFTNNGNIRDLGLRNIAATATLPGLPTGLRNLTLIFDNAAINLSAMILTGNLTVTAGGAITQSGAIAGSHLIVKTLNDTGAAINFTNGANHFTTINLSARNAADTANAAGSIAYTDAAGFDVGGINTADTVNLTAGGAIRDSGSINGTTLTTNSVGGTVLDFGHAITGFNATNSGSGYITLINSSSPSALTITGITQNGNGNVSVVNVGALITSGLISANSGNVNLATALNGNITINAPIQSGGPGNITITPGGVGIISLGANVTTQGGVISFNKNVNLTNSATVDSGLGLNSMINFAGNVVGANTLTLQNNLLANGNVFFNGDVSLAGLVTFAQPYAVIFKGATNTLANAVTFNNTNGVMLGNNTSNVFNFNGGLTNTASTTTLASVVNTNGAALNLNAVTLAGDSLLNTLGGVMTLGTINSNSVGVNNLTLNSGVGAMHLNGAIGNAIPFASLTTTGNVIDINTGIISTTNSQAYNGRVVLGTNTNMIATNIAFANGVSGAHNLMLSGLAGDNNFSFTGPLAVNNITVIGSTTGNNALLVNTNNFENWLITGINQGMISGPSLSGNFSFTRMQNLTGGNASNTFKFNNGSSVSGSINGGNLGATNTLDYSQYAAPVRALLGNIFYSGDLLNSAGSNITHFSNINNLIGNPGSTLQLPSIHSVLYFTSAIAGFVNDPLNFTQFGSFVALNSTNPVIFLAQAIYNSVTNQLTVNGVPVQLIGFNPTLFAGNITFITPPPFIPTEPKTFSPGFIPGVLTQQIVNYGMNNTPININIVNNDANTTFNNQNVTLAGASANRAASVLSASATSTMGSRTLSTEGASLSGVSGVLSMKPAWAKNGLFAGNNVMLMQYLPPYTQANLFTLAIMNFVSRFETLVMGLQNPNQILLAFFGSAILIVLIRQIRKEKALTLISSPEMGDQNDLPIMSFKLRTALNSINGFAELLYQEELDHMSKEQKKYLKHIKFAANRLVSDYLQIESANNIEMPIETLSFKFRSALNNIIGFTTMISNNESECQPLAKECLKEILVASNEAMQVVSTDQVDKK